MVPNVSLRKTTSSTEVRYIHPNQSSRRRRRPLFLMSSSSSSPPSSSSSYSSSSSSSAMVSTMTATALLIGILLSSSSASSSLPFNYYNVPFFVAASAVASSSSSSVRRQQQPQLQQFLVASASKKTAGVQPDYNLPKARGKKTPAHPWPVPSKQHAAAAVDYSASQQQVGAMQESTVENSSQGDVEDTNSALSFEEWLQFQQASSQELASQQQQQQQHYQSTMGETSSNAMSYDEWLLLQQPQNTQQTQQQAQQQKMGKQSAHVASMLLPPPNSEFSPNEDLDIMSGKRIILRPLGTATGDDSDGGSSTASANLPSDGVYYYDPAALTVSQSSLSSSSSSSSTTIEYDTNNNSSTTNNNTPELTLPETVYDEFGTPHDINDVHNEGRNEVYLEIKPQTAATSMVWGNGISSSHGKDFIGSVLSGSQWNTNKNDSSSLSSLSSIYSSQDQLIVFFTVATMAIMIGILSARRLRNRNMLVDCMHPDMDDEEDDLHLDSNSFSAGVTRAFGGVRYDKKYDVDTGRSVTGASSTGGTSALFDAASDDFGTLMGVGGSGSSSDRRKGSSYNGTNDVGVGIGGLHWRGDMEKFDV